MTVFDLLFSSALRPVFKALVCIIVHNSGGGGARCWGSSSALAVVVVSPISRLDQDAERYVCEDAENEREGKEHQVLKTHRHLVAISNEMELVQHRIAGRNEARVARLRCSR